MFDQNQLNAVEQATPRPITPPSGTAAVPPITTVAPPPGISVDNADIYYMPENFQKNNQVAGKNTAIRGIWVLVTIILLLVLLGGGLYAFWAQPAFLLKLLGREPATTTPVVTENPSTDPVPLAPATSTRPSGSPKEAYLVFRGELALADSVESYLAAYSKYATADRYASLLEEKNKIESSLPAGGDLLAALRLKPLPVLDGTEDIAEEVSDQRAVLTVSKTNKRQIGTVIFLPEKGLWKLSQELWQDSAEAEPASGSTTVAADDDGDGLSNDEEVLLATNPALADSDTDTYKDMAEVEGGYNPAGTGKLSDNKNLATYLNTTFNLSMLYPAAWQKTVATTDDSIVFTAEDGQFVQILIQPNSDREDIATWYKKTFNVEIIPPSQLITSAGWDGVLTTDGNIAYLTNKDKSYIFIAAYNLSATPVVKYKNVFNLMLRSLTLAS